MIRRERCVRGEDPERTEKGSLFGNQLGSKIAELREPKPEARGREVGGKEGNALGFECLQN